MDVWFPMVLSPALIGRPVTLISRGLRRHSFIAAVDVAAFAPASIGRREAVNAHIALGGPEAVSWRDVLATFSRILGREIPIATLAPGETIGRLPGIVAGLIAGLDTYDSIIPMTETAARFGVRQTNVDEFALGMLAHPPRAR